MGVWENSKAVKGGGVMINRKYVLVLLIGALFLFLLISAYQLNEIVRVNNANKKSKLFLEALIQGDYDEAEKLSLGEVKFNIATNKEKKFDSLIIDVDTRVLDINKNFSVVEAIIEYYLEKELNLAALRLYMVNDENKYKVYKIEEINPYFKRSFIKINNEDKTAIENCFTNYVRGIANKDYNESSKYLIGRAKTAHNATSELIKNTNLIVEPKDFSSRYIYGNRNNVVMQFEYTNNNRKVISVVSFYKTAEGWKIYDVSQI